MCLLTVIDTAEDVASPRDRKGPNSAAVLVVFCGWFGVNANILLACPMSVGEKKTAEVHPKSVGAHFEIDVVQ